MKLQNMKRGETTEQIALFNWAMRSTHVLPCLSLMYHVPNEGKYNLGNNTLLASHFLNVAVEINMNDSRMKPVKIEKRMRIDGAVSVFDAMTMVSKYHSEIGKKLLNEAA